MNYFLSITFLFAFHAFAQQEPLSDMYWNNYSYFNPAMSGVAYKHEANATYRSDFNIDPCFSSTLFINYGTNVKEKHAVGFNYVRAGLGSEGNNRFKLNYNYQIDIADDKKLVFGAALNYGRFGAYYCSNVFDSLMLLSYDHVFFLDAGVSFYGKHLIAGLGITQIPVFVESNRDWRPHLTGNLRYQLAFSAQPNFLILASAFRTDLKEYSQDFNLGYNYKNILEAGVGYRTTEMILFNLTGIVKDHYRIGYSFAYSLNNTGASAIGTHEITLGLRLPN